MPFSSRSSDVITLSNLSLYSASTCDVIPPLGPDFTRNLTSLRQTIKKSNSQETQLCFVRHLLEAAEKVLVDPEQLGIPLNTLPEGVSVEEAKQKMHDMFAEEAMKWLKKLAHTSPALGKTPHPEAQFMWAECLGNGSYGVHIDHKQAYILYTQASKQGHAAACFRTAVCHEFGVGTKKDPRRAIQFYEKAAALNDRLAMHKMARVLLHGRLGAQKNLKKGLQWLKRAAALADAKHPESLHDLALCFDPEDTLSIVIPDASYTAELFKKAADFGYAPSQHRLGASYEYGLLELEPDAEQSIRYYKMAAEQGFADSQLALANWFLVGAPGVLEQSDSDAFCWAQRAARANNARGMYMLAHCYEEGIGAEVSLEKARDWYRRSAEAGYRRAAHRLEELSGKKNKKRRWWRKLLCLK